MHCGLGVLLASAFRTGGEKRDAFDPDLSLAVHDSCGHRVERLALRAADGHADQIARRRDVAKVFAILVEHLHAVRGGDVETAVGIEAAAVTTAALPLGEA